MTDTKTALLESVEATIPLGIAESIDPKEFYQNRKGLYVWSGFKELILAKAESVKAGTAFTLQSSVLKKNASDEKIEAALPENHVFTESDVATIVAELISRQSEGQERTLLNDGYANLFYTPSCVVFVYWVAWSGEWSVRTYGRGGRDWFAGKRVFSTAS